MKTKTIIVATASVLAAATTTQSCVALATSAVGIAVLKKVLLGGITKGLGIFADKNSFLANRLIDAAMPSQLRELNNTLEKIGLGNLVQKEREYIAEAAAFTVDVSRPVLVNAVNSLTAEDVTRIVQGGSGAATKLLREKTETQLMAAIAPRVDTKLNEYGIVQTLNSAMAGNNLFGSIFGGQQNASNSLTSGISRLAAQQMVNGLFNIIEQHEQQNAVTLQNALQQNR